MAKAEKGTAKSLDVRVIAMEDVPPPPIANTWGKWNDLYRRVRALGMAERQAVKASFEGQKQFTQARWRLRKLAKDEGLRMLSSHNEDFTVGYFWLQKPE